MYPDRAKKIMTEALDKLKNGDSGAPFELKAIQALHFLETHRPADYIRWISSLKSAKVKQSMLFQEIKKYQKQLKLSKKANTPQDQQALKDVGLEIDPETGYLVGLNGNIYARYVLENFELRFVTGARFYLYKTGLWHYLSDNQFSRLLRDFIHEHAPDVWNTYWEKIYMEALLRETAEVEEMDSQRQYVNLANGMLDLDSFTLLPHKPKYYSSIRLPIIYNSKAKCPLFETFLNDIFQGDPQLIRNAGEILGYCLTAETLMHKAVFLTGSGSNGKSVFSAVLAALVGKNNISSVSLKDLENSFNRFNLIGKTVNLVTENEFGRSGLQTANFKAIVGGDTVLVEIKNGASFSTKLICKMVFATNNLPYSNDRSHGFLRRLHIIPFNETFVDEPVGKKAKAKLLKKNPGVKFKDKRLQEKLFEELPGILNLALEGLSRLRKNGWQFSPSKAISVALENYTNDTSPLSAFASECMVQGNKNDWLPYKNLYQFYKDWCEDNGHRKAGEMAQRNFSGQLQESLKQQGTMFDIGQKSGLRGILGMKFKLPGTEGE